MLPFFLFVLDSFDIDEDNFYLQKEGDLLNLINSLKAKMKLKKLKRANEEISNTRLKEVIITADKDLILESIKQLMREQEVEDLFELYTLKENTFPKEDELTYEFLTEKYNSMLEIAETNYKADYDEELSIDSNTFEFGDFYGYDVFFGSCKSL